MLLGSCKRDRAVAKELWCDKWFGSCGLARAMRLQVKDSFNELLLTIESSVKNSQQIDDRMLASNQIGAVIDNRSARQFALDG